MAEAFCSPRRQSYRWPRCSSHCDARLTAHDGQRGGGHDPEVAGSAASLLGLARFAFDGVTALLVGLAGPQKAVPLGVVTLAAALLGLVGYAVLRRPGVAVAAPQCLAAV